METREVPPEPRWKGAGTEDNEDGVLISTSDETNPITIGTKLEVGDIVVAVNGHLTPNVDALKQVLEATYRNTSRVIWFPSHFVVKGVPSMF